MSILTKFHVSAASMGKGKTKLVRGILTKMAATPIYGKKPSKIVLEPKANVCNILVFGHFVICSNDDPMLTNILPILWQGQI